MVVLFDLSPQPSMGALIIKVKLPSWNDKDRGDHDHDGDNDHDDDFDHNVDYDHDVDYDYAGTNDENSPIPHHLNK